MKILVAPLNWGLGHATRCVPIINHFMQQGHEVVIGGDGLSFNYLADYFPNLRSVRLPSLQLHYSETQTHVWTLFRQLPHFLCWLRNDAKAIQQLQAAEHFDIVISDNRFNLVNRKRSYYAIYITHQLHIALPAGLRWAERIAQRWHQHIIERYDECWVPDYPDFPSLAGILSHPQNVPRNIRYIGPLSRFQQYNEIVPTSNNITTLAIISGLEPQRSIFEKWTYANYEQDGLMVVNGISPYPTDEQMAQWMLHAKTIISRSGYSSIMDYAALGVMDKVRMIPTPGQPEQEYLAQLHNKHNK